MWVFHCQFSVCLFVSFFSFHHFKRTKKLLVLTNLVRSLYIQDLVNGSEDENQTQCYHIFLVTSHPKLEKSQFSHFALRRKTLTFKIYMYRTHSCRFELQFYVVFLYFELRVLVPGEKHALSKCPQSMSFSLTMGWMAFPWLFCGFPDWINWKLDWIKKNFH